MAKTKQDTLHAKKIEGKSSKFERYFGFIPGDPSGST